MNYRDFRKASLQKHRNFKLYKPKYVNFTTITTVNCPNCGDIDIMPSDHLKVGCSVCDFKIAKCSIHGHVIPCATCISKDIYNLPFADYKSLTDKIYDGEYKYKECTNRKLIGVVCKRHGEEISDKEDHLLRYKKCQACSYTQINYAKQTLYLTNLIKKYHLIYDYRHVDYVNESSKVKIVCPIHGDILVSPASSMNFVCKCG